MEVSVSLPRTVGILEVERVISALSATAEAQTSVNVDAQAVEFVDPLGLCMLSSFGGEWARRDVRVTFLGMKPHVKSYLERMDVLDHCRAEDRPTICRTPAATKLLEVTRVTDQADVNAAAEAMTCAVIGKLPDLEPDVDMEGMRVVSEHDTLTHVLGHVLTELMDNALTHGRRGGYRDANVWVSCQYMPKRDAMNIAVVDNGCGLLASLGSHQMVRDHPTHENVLRACVSEGVSCNRAVGLQGVESGNLGVGLTICQGIALQSDGNLWIGSGDRFARNPCGQGISYFREMPPWQGLFAYIEVRRSKLKGVQVHDILAPHLPARPARALRFDHDH